MPRFQDLPPEILTHIFNVAQWPGAESWVVMGDWYMDGLPWQPATIGVHVCTLEILTI